MEKTMKCIVFTGVGQYEILERDVPEIKKPDEVLIKVLAASICGSDVHYLATPPVMKAKQGVILGHECVGEVVKTGADVTAFACGDRVIVDNNATCGTCAMCQQGKPNLCNHMKSMGSMSDGVFADYFVAGQGQIVKISKDVPIEEAVFAEPLNCVMGAVKKLRIIPGSTALVLGGGPIGLLFSIMLKASGVGRVIVSEVSDYRSGFAKKCGADAVINPVKEDLREQVYLQTDGMGADIVVDAVGVLVADAIRCVGKGGCCLLFGLNDSKTETINQCEITMRGLTVMGSYIGGFALSSVARLLESRKLKLAPLVTHRMSMDRFGDGLNAMRNGEGLEVVLYPFGTEI